MMPFPPQNLWQAIIYAIIALALRRACGTGWRLLKWGAVSYCNDQAVGVAPQIDRITWHLRAFNNSAEIDGAVVVGDEFPKLGGMGGRRSTRRTRRILRNLAVLRGRDPNKTATAETNPTEGQQ